MMPKVAEALSTLHRARPSWSADVTDGPRILKRLAELPEMTPLFPEIPNDPPGTGAPLNSAHVFPSLAVPQPFVAFARTNVSIRMGPGGGVDAALGTGVSVGAVPVSAACTDVVLDIFSSGTSRQRTATTLRHRLDACTGLDRHLPLVV
jgi:hypothetical protein